MALAYLAFIFLLASPTRGAVDANFCPSLLNSVIALTKTDGQAADAMAQAVADYVGIGEFPEHHDYLTNLRNFFLKPLPELLGVEHIDTQKQLDQKVAETVTQHLASDAATDNQELFAKLKELLVRFRLGKCDSTFEINVLDSYLPIVQAHVKKLKFEQATAFNADFMAAQLQFRDEMEEYTEYLTEFECNCRRENGLSILYGRFKQLVIRFYKDNAALLAPAQSAAAYHRLFDVAKVILELSPKENKGLISVVSTTAGAPNADPAVVERLNAFRMKLVGALLREGRASLSDEELNALIMPILKTSIVNSVGLYIPFTPFVEERCDRGCDFDFKAQPRKSELLLVELVYAGLASQGDSAVQFSHQQLQQLIEHFESVYRVEPELAALIKEHAYLGQGLDLFTSEDKTAEKELMVAMRTLHNDFLAQAKSGKGLREATLELDRFIEQHYEEAHVKKFYHILKLWNLIKYFNDNQTDMFVDWNAGHDSAHAFRRLYKGDFSFALEKLMKKAESGRVNVKHLFAMFEFGSERSQVTVEGNKYDGPDAGKRIEVDFKMDVKGLEVKRQESERKKKRRVTTLRECETHTVVEEGTGDQWWIEAAGKRTQVDESDFNAAVEDCLKPRYHVQKRVLKKCEELVETVELREKPAEEGLFFVADEAGRENAVSHQDYAKLLAKCKEPEVPPSYTVRTHTVNDCAFSEQETLHQGVPKKTQELDIYIEHVDDGTRVIDKAAFEKIKHDCENPIDVPAVKHTIDDDCRTGEETTVYKRKLPVGVTAHSYFHVKDGKDAQIDEAVYEKMKYDCEHPIDVSSVKHTVDDDCHFAEHTTTYKRRLPEGVKPDHFFKVDAGKETEISAEDFAAIKHDCENPKTIDTFKYTVDDDCHFETLTTQYKRKVPAGVELESFFKVDGDNETKIDKATFDKIKHDCENPETLVSLKATIDDDCNMKEETTSYKRKFPAGVSAENYFFVENGEEKVLTKEKYAELKYDCENPVDLPAVSLTIDENCEVESETTLYKRKLPAGVELSNFFKKQGGEKRRVSQAEYAALDEACDRRELTATTKTIDEDCQESEQVAVHHRRMPQGEKAETFFHRVNGQDKEIGKEEYAALKHECDHPIDVPALETTIDENCEVSRATVTYKRKLPAGVEAESFFHAAAGERHKVDKKEFERLDKECDARTFVSTRTTIDDCDFSVLETTYKRRLPEGVKPAYFFKVVDGQETEISEQDYRAIKHDCDNPIDVPAVKHTVDDDCHFAEHTTTYKRRLPPGVEAHSFFKLDGENETKIDKAAFDKIKHDCENPIEIETVKKTVDEDCEFAEFTTVYKRKLPEGVELESFFKTEKGVETKIDKKEFQQIAYDCEHPKDIDAKRHTVDDDCHFGTETTTYQRRLPEGVKLESFFHKTQSGETEISAEDFAAIKHDCENPKTIDTFKYTVDDDCHFGTETTQYKRKVPAGVELESFFKVDGDNETKIDKATFDKIKHDCYNPIEIESEETTIDEDCGIDEEVTVYKRKLPAGVELENFFQVVNGERKRIDKARFKELKYECDHPKEIVAKKTLIDADCHISEQSTTYKRKLPAGVELESFALVSKEGEKPLKKEEFEQLRDDCEHPIEIIAKKYTVSEGCRFATEVVKYKRRLPDGAKLESFFRVDGDGETEISAEEYEQIKDECSRSRPLDTLGELTTTRTTYVLQKCKVDVIRPVGKIRGKDKAGVKQTSYVIVKEQKWREVTRDEFIGAQKRCSFHLPEHEVVYPAEDEVLEFEVEKHLLRPDCSVDVIEEVYEGAKPADFAAQTWFRLREDGSEESLDEAGFQTAQAECLQRRRSGEHKIPSSDPRKNIIKMIRGAFPEQRIDELQNEPELVDYLKRNPVVYDPEEDTETEFIFVQVAREGSPCLEQLSF